MQTVRFVGLDVHKESITIAVADGSGGKAEVFARIANDTKTLLKHLKKLGSAAQLRCCYEAGPTGFVLHRELQAAGIDVVVIAPSLVPKRAGDHVKTDRRDAIKLAHFLRSGDLTEVYVPDTATEAMRDLERAREDAKNAQGVARNQLSKFLLRHGRRWDHKTTWTLKHMEWIRSQLFDHEAHNCVLVDYVKAVDDAKARVTRLTKDITALVETWTLRPLVKALQALRGVALLTSATLTAEIGDFARFATAPKMMGFTGLVPSEHSSGNEQKRSRITHAGNAHVRRALVEAAWAYRFRPCMSEAIRARNRELSEEVQAIAWKAQHRLHHRYLALHARGKRKQQIVTALARELAGFVWAIAREPKLLATAA
jgi:transposase